MDGNSETFSGQGEFVPVLTTYIFVMIFQNLRDLLSEVRMTRAMPEFVEDAVREWRKQHAAVGPNEIAHTLRDAGDYCFFMRNMAPHFKRFMIVVDLSCPYHTLQQYLQHLRQIGLNQLPAVEQCILDGFPKSVGNDDLLEILEIMPNIKKLKCHLSVNAQHLARYKRVEELHFYSENFPVRLVSAHILQIFTSLRNLRVLDLRCCYDYPLRASALVLPNLERLQLSWSIFVIVVEAILALPRLRMLGVMKFDASPQKQRQANTFQTILQQKAAYITAVAVNNHTLQLKENWDRKLGVLELPNLRSLTFESWEHKEPLLSRHNYPRSQLEKYGCSLWRNISERSIVQLVHALTSLKELSLTYSHFEQHLLPQVKDILTKPVIGPDGGNQQRPRLIIRNYCNLLWENTPEVDKAWREDKYVSFETKKFCDFDFLANSFELEFLPKINHKLHNK